MEIYLVGGAVRDRLLGLSVSDRDWVIVGGDPALLKAEGYRPVGKDFPVYLHPESHEEYALARTERKTGPGHTGFDCDAGPTVSLEEDLYRRDLTINAIAEDASGQLIDPFHGFDDLQNRILRHVSPAFSEDPLRVLRVARFAARFPDFAIHPDTCRLMQEMVQRGDLQTLTPERVFLETEKALSTDAPYIFFRTINEVGAHQILWPEITQGNIDRLKLWPPDHVPLHAFVLLLIGLESETIDRLARRLKCPANFQELARMTSRFFDTWADVDRLTAEAIVTCLYDLDAFRRPDRFKIACALALEFSLPGNRHNPDPWITYIDVAAEVTMKDISAELSGPAIGQAIRQERISRIAALR